MTAAEEARRFAGLADSAGVAPAPPKPLPTGLENREPAAPDAESPEQFFERVALERLRSEPCDG